jgi:hypothetical protein
MYTGLLDSNNSKLFRFNEIPCETRRPRDQYLSPLLNHGFSCSESCSCKPYFYQQTIHVAPFGSENIPVQVCCDIPLSSCSQYSHKRPLPNEDGWKDYSPEEMFEKIAQMRRDIESKH